MYDQKVYENVCKYGNGEVENMYDEKGHVQSTYKGDYKVKEIPDRVPGKTQTTALNLPFEGISTYKRDYKEPETMPVVKRPKDPERVKLPFEGVSIYTSDFSMKAWKYFGKT